MKRFRAVAGLALAVLSSMLPVAAATQFVQDGAGIFSQGVVSQLEGRLVSFNAQTGKEVVVVTVPSLPAGQSVQAAAQSTATQQQVNGTLIYIASGDRKAYVLPDSAAARAGWFTAGTSATVVQDMTSQFKAGNYDAGITSAVNDVLNIYRSHLSSLQRPGNGAYAQPASARAATTGGVHLGMFWWILIAIVAFLVIRSVMRAASGPRSYGPGPMAGGPGGPGGPGYGGGYGPGYGGFGGGGGFWSGLLGGLGGAFLGNELFRGGGGLGGGFGGADASAQGQPPADAGGWQSDPGQTDPGAGAGGDWGGGGFGDLGGGGGGFGGGGDGGGGGSW
ncbi:MAG TPA: TPM domain-containing protein [Candidatus Baltobacteraceae bacterium]|jgi:uncharacterized membrane protein YgcG